MSNPVRYIAESRHVREVSLLGTADLMFWTERLRQERLVPTDHRGGARILVTAAEMTFRGLRFTEATFSIFVCVPEQEDQREAALLLQAFNSSRLFAWCERKLFSTPYRHGRCRVSPVSICILERDQIIFEATMRPSAVLGQRLHLRGHGFEGPVFLPNFEGGNGGVFFVRISGGTETYPFVKGQDSIRIVARSTSDVFQNLLDSNFSGEQWLMRPDATHARSTTYQRGQLRQLL